MNGSFFGRSVLVLSIIVSSVLSNDMAPDVDLNNTLMEQQQSTTKDQSLESPLTVTDYSQLTGVWENISSSGIVKVQVLYFSGRLYVKVYGNCTPTPCDWGWVIGKAYANTVSSTVATGFSAFYDPGFKETIVTAKRNGTYLYLSTYSEFKDGSGRSNYHWHGYFTR